MASRLQDDPLILFDGVHACPNVHRDFAEWHKGRGPYVFWALDIDTPEVRQTVSEVAGQLDGLLLCRYRRQPHITVEVCGFPISFPEAPDEFSPDWLASQCAALRLAAIAPFTLTIGGVSSFASAPFVKVIDPALGIAALRNSLAVNGEPRLLGDYVPHVTVGLYADAWPAEMLGERLMPFADRDPLQCRIDRLSLMAYQPNEIGGPLAGLGHFSLDRQAMEWQIAWPFAAAF